MSRESKLAKSGVIPTRPFVIHAIIQVECGSPLEGERGGAYF